MKITVKDKEIELVRDYLTNGEVNYIVSTVLKMYKQSGDIDGYRYSPLTMLTNFYALLFGFCIEGYDIESDDDYNKYYNIGTQYELLKVVTNADEAYHLAMELSNRLNSIENIVDINMNKFVELVSTKMTDIGELQDIMNKLPNEWKEVAGQFNKITGNDNKEDV